jgi:hypothetical protein
MPLVSGGSDTEVLPSHEIKPLILQPLNTLGEPDPSNITK